MRDATGVTQPFELELCSSPVAFTHCQALSSALSPSAFQSATKGAGSVAAKRESSRAFGYGGIPSRAKCRKCLCAENSSISAWRYRYSLPLTVSGLGMVDTFVEVGVKSYNHRGFSLYIVTSVFLNTYVSCYTCSTCFVLLYCMYDRKWALFLAKKVVPFML